MSVQFPSWPEGRWRSLERGLAVFGVASLVLFGGFFLAMVAPQAMLDPLAIITVGITLVLVAVALIGTVVGVVRARGRAEA